MTEHVCPVGALTTQDFRFKARVWFLRTARDASARAAPRAATRTSTTTRATTRPTATGRATTSRSTSTGCATRACSRTRRAHEGRVLEAKVRGAATSTVKALEEVKKLFAGVPKEGIGVVLSAQHSLEDNWALLELARVLIETPHVFETGKPRRLRGHDPHPPRQEPEHQGRRRSSLREPSRSRRSSTTSRPAASRTCSRSAGRPRARPRRSRQAKVVTIAVARRPADGDGDGAPAGDVVGGAVRDVRERQGHAPGEREGARAARAPASRGGARCRDVASALGYEAQWTKLKQIRAQLIGGAAIETAARGSDPRRDARVRSRP